MIVTLDGPAGSGKSTVAKSLAEKLSLYQIDSGAFYRFYTHLGLLYAAGKNKSIEDIVESADFLSFIHAERPEVSFKKGKQNLAWKGENMEKYIRLPEITANIKQIADHRTIREEVNRQINDVIADFPVIADGRDMGTVVFPQADFKFFLTADLDTRAKRRMNEFRSSNPSITFEEVKAQIAQRDSEDEKREFGKLLAAKDAIFVDTTNLEINAVVQLIANIIQNTKP